MGKKEDNPTEKKLDMPDPAQLGKPHTNYSFESKGAPPTLASCDTLQQCRSNAVDRIGFHLAAPHRFGRDTAMQARR